MYWSENEGRKEFWQEMSHMTYQKRMRSLLNHYALVR